MIFQLKSVIKYCEWIYVSIFRQRLYVLGASSDLILHTDILCVGLEMGEHSPNLQRHTSFKICPILPYRITGWPRELVCSSVDCQAPILSSSDPK